MKRDPIRCVFPAGVAAALLALAPGAWPAQPAAGESGSRLDAAFRTCVSLADDPVAGDLMRTIFDRQARDAFEAAHADAVRSLSIERGKGYSTAIASLKNGVSVAGVPVRDIYASTCELECRLAVWGLEFGRLTPAQQEALRSWAASAPVTHTETDRDIQVQFNTTSEGEGLLVCDVSG